MLIVFSDMVVNLAIFALLCQMKNTIEFL